MVFTRASGWTAVWFVAGFLPLTGWSYEQFHIGVDFLATTIVPDDSFTCDLDPFPFDSSAHFVSQGALQGLSNEAIHRAVVMAAEDAFRAVDTGDPNTTLRVAIHDGRVPTDMEGRRLNVALGQFGDVLPAFKPFGLTCPEGLLGQAKKGSYQNSYPQDEYAAVVLVDRVDAMGETFVVYDTLPKAVNAIAGTLAHEIGHMFDLDHVPATGDPEPLLAREVDGLPVSARFTPRRFSTIQPLGHPNATILLENIGTAVRGDINFDGTIDAMDASIMFSVWGTSDRLYHEGDASGDHLVDALDASIAFANWTGDSVTAMAVPEPSVRHLALIAALVLRYGLTLGSVPGVSSGNLMGGGSADRRART